MATLEIPTEFLESMNWINTHRPELRETYEGQWIAVCGQQVVAASSNFGDAQTQAIKKTGQPANRLAIVFVDGPHHIYFLAV